MTKTGPKNDSLNCDSLKFLNMCGAWCLVNPHVKTVQNMYGKGNKESLRPSYGQSKYTLREGSGYQIGWIFGKMPNGLWPPSPPNFWGILLQFLYDIYGCIYARRYDGWIVWNACTWFPDTGVIQGLGSDCISKKDIVGFGGNFADPFRDTPWTPVPSFPQIPQVQKSIVNS